MDGINRHATTSQPSFGSNTRTKRFRLNLPTSLIRQLQPILNNNSTSTKKLAQDRPFRVLCRRSAARRPRKDRISASRSLPCPRRPAPYPRRKDRDSSYVIPIAADLPQRHSPYLENKCSSLSMPSAADLPRLFQLPPCNSRLARFIPASEVIQRVEIA